MNISLSPAFGDSATASLTEDVAAVRTRLEMPGGRGTSASCYIATPLDDRPARFVSRGAISALELLAVRQCTTFAKVAGFKWLVFPWFELEIEVAIESEHFLGIGLGKRIQK